MEDFFFKRVISIVFQYEETSKPAGISLLWHCLIYCGFNTIHPWSLPTKCQDHPPPTKGCKDKLIMSADTSKGPLGSKLPPGENHSSKLMLIYSLIKSHNVCQQLMDMRQSQDYNLYFLKSKDYNLYFLKFLPTVILKKKALI